METLGVAQSPFAGVVSKRGAMVTVFGQFNMRKAESPWRDVRLRQAINLAVNREELIRDIKGQGVIIAALAPEGAFGYDPALTPYPFDPDEARHLRQEAGYPDGITLAPKITVEDAELDLTAPAQRVDRLVRGCNPSPGAWTA